jgi:two-component system, cell cycle sensor histidine kinase and response regulator CckA
MNVHSEPDQGMTFKVYFPRCGGDVESVPTERPVGSTTRGKETILLAEDEPAMLELFTMLLQMQGYTVLPGMYRGRSHSPGQGTCPGQIHCS